MSPTLGAAAVPPSLSQAAAEKMRVSDLADVLFGELGSPPPEAMSGYFIHGNAGWPPFIFSEVWMLGTPHAAANGTLCEVARYDIQLKAADPNATLDDQRGPNALRTADTIAVEKRWHALDPGQTPAKACGTMMLIKASSLADAARAVQLLGAISPRLGPDAPFKVDCSGDAMCARLIDLRRRFTPDSLTDVGFCDDGATTCHMEFNTVQGPGSWAMDVTLNARAVTSVTLTPGHFFAF